MLLQQLLRRFHAEALYVPKIEDTGFDFLLQNLRETWRNLQLIFECFVKIIREPIRLKK